MKRNLAIAAILAIVLYFFFGFRINHPYDGLQSAMGSAKSSLAVYHKSDSFGIGDKVTFEVTVGEETRMYIGKVITKEGGGIGIDANHWMGVVKPEQIHGKLFVVVPFFGTVLGFVGL